MKYRSKPVEVEAFKFTADSEVTAPKWFAEQVNKDRIFVDRILRDGAVYVYGCSIKTPNGSIKAKVGDYVIKDAYGRISACKANAFHRDYEKVC